MKGSGFPRWAAWGLIVLLSLAAYANTFQGDFVWDDSDLILNNENIKSWGNLPQILVLDLFQNSQHKPANKVGYYRPIINLTYLLDYSLYGKNPTGYHITNLIWHTACGVLIFLLIRLLFDDVSLSLITSLLFVAHPIHTESVAWIAGRTDIICSFFYFASLYLYSHRYLASSRKNFYPVLSVLFFSLALVSKEMAVTLPLALILIDCLFIIKKINFRSLSARLKSWIPYWGVLTVYLLIRYKVANLELGNKSPTAFVDKFHIILTFGRALIVYLKKLTWPVALSPHIMIELVTSPFSPEVILASLIFFGSLYIAYLKFNSSKAISLSILLFWISMIPVTNLVPIQLLADTIFPMAERYLYLSSFAFCLLAAALLRSLSQATTKWIYLERIIPVFLLLFYTGETVYANTFWRDNFSLFRRAVELSPESPMMSLCLANEYAKKQDYDAAIHYYLRAIELKSGLRGNQFKPNLSDFYARLGHCYFAKDDIPKAVDAFKDALRYNDKNEDAIVSLGNCYLKTGENGLAVEEFKKALKLNSKYRRAQIITKTGEKLFISVD